MNIILRRTLAQSSGIFGNFHLETGEFFCVTLEHAYLSHSNWIAKVPPGVYTCKRRMSPHFGYEVFEVMDVPNCSYIEIHVGNFLQDSEGCILVGESVSSLPSGGDCITNSRKTFADFMRLQNGNETFQLTVS